MLIGLVNRIHPQHTAYAVLFFPAQKLAILLLRQIIANLRHAFVGKPQRNCPLNNAMNFTPCRKQGCFVILILPADVLAVPELAPVHLLLPELTKNRQALAAVQQAALRHSRVEVLQIPPQKIKGSADFCL